VGYMKETNWPFSYSVDLVPPYLSLKGQDLLSILLWEQGGPEPKLRNVTQDFKLQSLEDIKRKCLILRKRALETNSKQLQEEFGKTKLLDFFAKEGFTVNEQLLSYSSYPRHPMCDILVDISNEMTEVISKIVLFESSPFLDWDDTPELLDVEYLPLPTKGLYFSPKRGNPLSRKKHSQFVLTAYFNKGEDQDLTCSHARTEEVSWEIGNMIMEIRIPAKSDVPTSDNIFDDDFDF
jgi:hypothetical protein